MKHNFLVTYATKYGSTTGVAEAIAKTLMENSHQVDLFPAREVKSVDGYDAIIVGSPLYIGNILGDVSKFLSRNKNLLKKTPTAFFVLGPLENKPEDIEGVQKQLDPILKRLSWLQPVDSKIFVGALGLEKLRFPDSMVKLGAKDPNSPMRTRDERDWPAIREWALSLPEKLGLNADVE